MTIGEDTVIAALEAAIQDECGAPPKRLDRDSTAADVQGWDSLAHVRIMMNVESRLGIMIDMDKSYRAATIGQLVEFIVADAQAGPSSC